MILRGYQQKIHDGVFHSWQHGHKNVLVVSPTGSGKTKTKAAIIKSANMPAIQIAHRQELVSQISTTLAEMGVRHRIMAAKETVKFTISRHVKTVGNSYYDPQADMMVASVDTLIRRMNDKFINRVGVVDIDEAHHCVPGNKWGRALEMFPRAWGLGVTATPVRTDGQPLGLIYSDMVLGPTTDQLMREGFLCDIKIFAPKASYEIDPAKISKTTGDYNINALREASHDSGIVGDMVNHYKQFANGKRAICFVVDVETAKNVAAKFSDAGVPAAAITEKTPDTIRQNLIERFADIADPKVLVCVDILSEGVDVPAVECVIFGRKTESLQVFVQQLGRVMRPFPGKEFGIVIDCVDNVIRHKLTFLSKVWELETEGKKKSNKDDDDIPLTACTGCFQVYERFHKVCPYCGTPRPVVSRCRDLEAVDGDLTELDPQILAMLKGRVLDLEKEASIPYGATPAIIGARNKNWNETVEAQRSLRNKMSQWAGIQRHNMGLSDAELHRLFYLQYGTDVLTAQGLNIKMANELAARIKL